MIEEIKKRIEIMNEHNINSYDFNIGEINIVLTKNKKNYETDDYRNFYFNNDTNPHKL